MIKTIGLILIYESAGQEIFDKSGAGRRQIRLLQRTRNGLRTEYQSEDASRAKKVKRRA